MMPALSPESKERLKEMLCMRVDGATMREIADKYGCSHQYVQMRFSKLLAAQKDPHCIYSAIAEWMSIEKVPKGFIAHQLGISVPTLKKRLEGKSLFTVEDMKILVRLSGIPFEKLSEVKDDE